MQDPWRSPDSHIMFAHSSIAELYKHLFNMGVCRFGTCKIALQYLHQSSFPPVRVLVFHGLDGGDSLHRIALFSPQLLPLVASGPAPRWNEDAKES